MEEQSPDGLPHAVLHPHRKLYVVIVVVAFVLLLVVIASYRVMKMRNATVEHTSVPAESGTLPVAERDKILTNLQEAVAKAPPLTNTERAKILASLKKAVVKSKANQ